MKIKQNVDRREFLRVLHQLVDQLEGNREVNLSIQGQSCRLPADVLDMAELEIEYEDKEHKTELEFSIEILK